MMRPNTMLIACGEVLSMSWWKRICGLDAETIEYDQPNKKLVLVVYDITDNKRRYRVHKCLKSYGTRVQRSAFECFLTETQYYELAKKLRYYIKEDEDLLRLYKFPANTTMDCWGNIGRLEKEDDFWIV